MYLVYLFFFFLMLSSPLKSTLFPYTTLFRSKLGFHVTVYMSSDAKQWKKDLLREKGVLVKEFAGDFSVAIKDRKSTRLNSSHVAISYAVFCLKKKNRNNIQPY